MNIRNRARKVLADYLIAHPELTYRAIAESLGCSLSTINNVAREFHIVRLHKITSDDFASNIAKLSSRTEVK